MWERMLTGDLPRLQRMRRIWGALPSPPRCKLCNAPFRGVGGVLMRAIAYGPSPLNRRLCNWCIRGISKQPGGAEVEISVLVGDGAVALFIPSFTENRHASNAIAAARGLLEHTGDDIPLGVGVHTGPSF